MARIYIARMERPASGKGRGGNIGTVEARQLAAARWKDRPKCKCGKSTLGRMKSGKHRCL